MIQSFDVGTATRYGVKAAVLLQYIGFCLSCNDNSIEISRVNGESWMRHSVTDFGNMFPFMSAVQIRRSLKSMEEQGLIKSGYQATKYWDRTLWYTLTEKGRRELKA